MTILEQISIELDKTATMMCGDAIQYFKDNPGKLKEKLKRDKMKERLKRMKKRRDPDGIEKDAAIPMKGISEEMKYLLRKMTTRNAAKKPSAEMREKIKEDFSGDGHNKTAQPSAAQAKAGNYKMKHIRYNGMEISIENPAGSNRSGVGGDGKKWTSHMFHHYGYIRGTMGKDKDHVDVFIKPGTKETEKVFIVNQQNKDGKFDEHKCMLGFDTKKEAQAAYLKNYEKGWKVGPTVEMSIDNFKKWVYSGRKMGPAKTKVSKMEKTAYIEEVYNEAFTNELEKIAFNPWHAFGKTKVLAKELGKSTQAARRDVRSGITGLTRDLKSAKGEVVKIKKRKVGQAAKVKGLSSAGSLEKFLGGRFGTRSIREGRLAGAQTRLGKTEAALTPAQTRVRSLAGKAGYEARAAGGKMEDISKRFRRGSRDIRLRQAGNIAVRGAILGTGAYGAGRIAHSQMSRGY